MNKVNELMGTHFVLIMLFLVFPFIYLACVYLLIVHNNNFRLLDLFVVIIHYYKDTCIL